MRRDLFSSGQSRRRLRLISCLSCVATRVAARHEAAGAPPRSAARRQCPARDHRHAESRSTRLTAVATVSRRRSTQLAANGVRYAHAMSHVPMTLPAHTAILTGLHAARARRAQQRHVPPRTIACPTARDRSSSKRAIGPAPSSAPSSSTPASASTRGFDDVRRSSTARRRRRRFTSESRGCRSGQSAPAIGFLVHPAASASAPPSALSPEPQPWFAWVHLFDPHAPYDAPPEFHAEPDPVRRGSGARRRDAGPSDRHAARRRSLDRTAIVVTADHGESLGEHGETTHGLFAYESTLHVPMILSGRGDRAGGRRGSRRPRGPAADAARPRWGQTAGDARGTLADRPAGRRPCALHFEALDAYLTRGWAPLTGVVQAAGSTSTLPEAEAMRPGERLDRSPS